LTFSLILIIVNNKQFPLSTCKLAGLQIVLKTNRPDVKNQSIVQRSTFQKLMHSSFLFGPSIFSIYLYIIFLLNKKTKKEIECPKIK